jgi:hypothetical protein
MTVGDELGKFAEEYGIPFDTNVERWLGARIAPPRPRLALSTLGKDATVLGAISLALNTAERIILPSAIVGPLSPLDASGILQPFLDVPPTEQSKNV